MKTHLYILTLFLLVMFTGCVENNWIANETPLAEPGNYVHKNYYREKQIDNLEAKLKNCPVGTEQGKEFDKHIGINRVHRHFRSRKNISDDSITIIYDLPELHEDGIRWRQRFLLEVIWSRVPDRDILKYKSGRLIPYED